MSALPVTTDVEESVMQFGALEIAYDARVLEPRPWTTMQADWARELAVLAPEGPVLELCSGAGQIGLLTIHAAPRSLVAVDASETACTYIRANAWLAELADVVEVRNADLAEACAEDEQFPVILADPPWVPHDDIGRFPEDPVSAIDGGSDGLSVARLCVDVIDKHLMDDGVALLQLGSSEQADVLERSLPGSLAMAECREEPGRGAVVKLTRS